MNEVKWGIIGCGEVTEKKSGPAFSRVPGSKLVAVMRRDGAKAEDYARRHGVPRWYDRAEDLINDPEVNAVYVATPPAFHRDFTLQVATAGKPIYVEKPMALNSVQCDEMVAACRQAGVPLFVAYYRRALPRFLKIRELVESGVLGTIDSFRILLQKPPSMEDLEHRPSWRVDPTIAGGGYFIDLAPHTIDFIDYILGPISEVRGFADNRRGYYPAEDNLSAIFRTDAGIHGTGSWSFTAEGERDEVEIFGSLGCLSFSTFLDHPIVLRNNGSQEEFIIPHPPHVQEPLINLVVDDLLGRGSCPSTGETAARTTRITDEILRDYYRD